MNKKTIKEIDVKNKTVLVRADFNVPIENREISDDFKIKKSLDTINYLLKNNAKIVLMSHLGKPKGKVVESLRMNPIAKRLGEMLNKEIKKLDNCVGQDIIDDIKDSNFGDVILLENVRFHPEEEKNDPEFAKQLSKLGEIFCVDGFGSVHRAHASVSGVAKFLPAVAGLLLEREVDVLTNVLEKPEHPYLVILGGAKISTKLGLINKLAKEADKVLIAGALSNTIFLADGMKVGKSMVEPEMEQNIKQTFAENRNLEIPVDLVVANSVEDGARIVEVGQKILDNESIYDIGPKTISFFEEEIENSKLVVWNGPMGKFEDKKFAKGTDELVKALAGIQKAIVGGGETSMAVRKLGMEDKIYHLSTGGGAMLEFLEKKPMPGIDCLSNK